MNSRGRCVNLVANDSGMRYCRLHREGWRERWAQFVGAEFTRKYTERSPAGTAVWDAGGRGAGIPSPRAAEAPSPREVAARHRLGLAVAEAYAIAGPQWRQASEWRVAVSLGPALHRHMRATVGLCDDLAEVANGLSRLSDLGDRALEHALTPQVLQLLRNPGLTKLVTRNFAAQTVPASSTSTVALVNALRALGVLTCVLDGSDLVGCRCLWPLAGHGHEQSVRNDVRMVVRYGLERIPAAWMVVDTAADTRRRDSRRDSRRDTGVPRSRVPGVRTAHPASRHPTMGRSIDVT